MCFGGGSSPQAPEVKYVGPSDKDIRRNQESLDDYRSEINAQQQTFQSQLQDQIDQANAETEALQNKYADDLAAAEEAGAAGIADAEAAGAAGIADAEAAGAAATTEAGAAAAAQQVGAYTVTATESEALQAQTTAAIEPKKKPKKNLKISTAGTSNSGGSGINLGI